MKISLKWLNNYVDVQDYYLKPDKLAEILTRAGLEVEEITNRAKDFEQVVVGLILEKDKHPNADKLSLCQVTTGEGIVHQIVCGAQNHKQGDRVIVALPGALLPGNFAIKLSAIRGVESSGMLCSLKELGLATESAGISILPESARVGQSFAEFGGYDDVTFELKVTANRADCLSHFGLAREVACLLNRELKTPKAEPKLSAGSTQAQISLEVKTPELCPRYTGRFIKSVKVGVSPDWLKKRLESVGLNSINNVVDITNYVMMELGQPLHAFDASNISGNKITVDVAVPKEKFITLDGSEKTLTGDELTIRDAQQALCLAGVIGGKNSGVSEATQDVFLESAYFSAVTVRKTSRLHNANTDSGYRFARGVDPDGALRGLDRATALILEVAGGEAFGDHHDFYPVPVKKLPVNISVQMVSDRLGYEADETKFVDFMKRLGCEVIGQNGQYEVLPPNFRFDIEQDMDLVEEYARLNGYEHIPDKLPVMASTPTVNDPVFILNQKTSEVLRAQGFSQAFNYAFVGDVNESKFLQDVINLNKAGLLATTDKIKLLNPLNEEMDSMRSSLSYGLFKNANGNFHYGNHQGRLFEMGICFSKTAAGAYCENLRAGLIAWGQAETLWNSTAKHPLVFEVKAAAEALLKQFSIGSYTWVTPPVAEVPAFIHPGQCAHLLVEGKKVGYIGTIHPGLTEENKIRVPMALAEFDLDQLYKGQPRSCRVQSISKLPVVQRDFALSMPHAQKIGDVLRDIRKSVGPLLVNVEVFDVYEGEKIEAGKKSVAIRLWLQDKNATLQDAQIAEVQKKVLESLEKNFSITIR